MPLSSFSPHRFDAGNPGSLTGPGNNTWLVDGAVPTLVDAGVGRPAHVDGLARHLGDRPLARVLVTHGHADHASGVPALRARWPRLEVWRFGATGADAAGSQAMTDGQRLDAGDTELRVVHTPGHAPDHVCFLHEASRSLFVGDMLAIGTTVMIPAGRGGHLRSYLVSLRRLAALQPTRAWPGHGPTIDDPRALIAEYLDHRAMRERQVLACVKEGVTRVDDIVGRVYPELAADLRPAAAVTVQAHLVKLREDGVIPSSEPAG